MGHKDVGRACATPNKRVLAVACFKGSRTLAQIGVSNMSHEISRRHFVSTAAMTVAGVQIGVSPLAHAQQTTTSTAIPPIKPGTKTSFASLKQIDAGLLNVGYAEDGPADGSPVVLLHGWP